MSDFKLIFGSQYWLQLLPGDQNMITLTLIISVLFVLLAVCQASDDNSNDPYLGRCALQPQTAFPCMKALFLSEFAKKELPLLPLYPTLVDASVGSDLSFDFHALSTFCSLPTEKTAARGNFILLARRGDCVFDTKAKVAEAIGAKGLLILNSPLQQELVPMGSSEEDYFASIPVVLATSTAFNTALLTSNITLLEARVSIDSKDRVRRTSGEEEVPVATSPLLASIATAWAISRLLVVVIFFIIAKNALDGFFISDGMYKTISSVSRAEVRYLPAVLLLLLVFVLLRLTTLRPMEDTSYTYDYGLLAKYNHRETDEVIFEVRKHEFCTVIDDC